jgi:hypothetical protein
MRFGDPPGIVRPAEDLDALARRVKEREKKSRKNQLAHAKAQAADVRAARKLARHGQWGPWCERAGLSNKGAWNYVEFGKLVVTTYFQALSEDAQWEEWQRIQGNVGQKEGGPEGAERPGKTVSYTVSSPPPGPPREIEVKVYPGPTIGGEFEAVRTPEGYVVARRNGEGEPRQEEGQAGGEIKPLGVGVFRGHEAIDCLSRIPKDDRLRGRGFQIVMDWIRNNGGDEAAEVCRLVAPLLNELDEAGRRGGAHASPAAVRKITTGLRRALAPLFPALAPEKDREP